MFLLLLGDEVMVSDPEGTFDAQSRLTATSDILLIAAGSGKHFALHDLTHPIHSTEKNSKNKAPFESPALHCMGCLEGYDLSGEPHTTENRPSLSGITSFHINCNDLRSPSLNIPLEPLPRVEIFNSLPPHTSTQDHSFHTSLLFLHRLYPNGEDPS